ncbi:MAG: HD domain-containing phosphohydrolase [Spirochaetales bacterium]
MSTPVVLCVDDEPIIIQSLRIELRNALSGQCTIETAESGEEALEIFHDIQKDGRQLALLISDQNMPGMKGHELLARVKQASPQTYTILLTGFSDLEGVKQAVNNADLYRYITKPWKKEEFIFTIREALRAFQQETLIQQQEVKIERLTFSMINALEAANLSYDEDTSFHILRVSEYSAFLAESMGKDMDFVQRIRTYSKLHDIGKVGVACQLLNKPGQYTPEEFEIMKKHVWYGHQILSVEGIDEMARNIAWCHHERWDGSGYQRGLRGEGIPIEARIVAVADVFDALLSQRIYKPPMPFEKAFGIVCGGAGSHFDPAIIEVFQASHDDLFSIRERVNSMESLSSQAIESYT